MVQASLRTEYRQKLLSFRQKKTLSHQTNKLVRPLFACGDECNPDSMGLEPLRSYGKEILVL